MNTILAGLHYERSRYIIWIQFRLYHKPGNVIFLKAVFNK